LNQTIDRFIDKSFQGLTAKDLFNILSVPCHPVLNQMYKKEKIDRFNTPKGFVYLSSSFELSVAVEKKGVKASQQAVAQLFKDYDLKKNPP